MVTINQKPKHKPSEKHTLEEVLKSLRDLIRNDIIDGNESSPPAATTPPLTEKGTADEMDIDAVLDSLKDLIIHELESPETEAGKPATEQEHPSDQLEEITFEAPDVMPRVEDRSLDTDTESLTPPSPPRDWTVAGRPQGEDQGWSESQPPAPPGGRQETFSFNEPLPTIEVEETSLADMPDIDFASLKAPTAPETGEHSLERADAPSEDAAEFTPKSKAEPLTAPDAPVNKEEGVELTDTPETRQLRRERNWAHTVRPQGEDQGRSASQQKLEAADVGGEKETPLVAQDATEDEETVPADAPATGDRDIPAATDTEEVAEISLDALPEDLSAIPSIEFDNVLEKAEETHAPETGDRGQIKPPGAPLPEETPPEMPVTADTVEAPEQADAETLEKDTPPAATVDYPSPAGLEADVIPGVTPEDTPQPAEAKLPGEDDIPVLDEVAAQPPEAVKPVPPEISLPAPGRAREIAIKIIAKLNIELRKCGERGLSPATIDRLQYLLRKALEQGVANKKSMKH